jgi:hypothetical protein
MKRTGTGLETRVSKVTPDEVLQFERECREAYGAIDRLTFCAIDGHAISTVLQPSGMKNGPAASS